MSVTFRLAKDNNEELYVNLSNRNAYDLLVVLGRPAEETYACYGCWDQQTIGQALVALRDEEKQKAFEIPEEREGNIISFGRDEDYCRRRFSNMRELCAEALEHNLEIVFS